MSVTLSFRAEEATVEAIDKIAATLDRDRAWILSQAVKEYLDFNAWHVEQIMEGIRDIEAGRTYSLDEVKAMVEAKISEVEAARNAKAAKPKSAKSAKSGMRSAKAK